METDHTKPAENGEQKPMVKVTMPTTEFTRSVLKEANLMVIGIPLGMPSYSIMGFLWSILSELTNFHAMVKAETEKKKSGILIPGFGRVGNQFKQ